MGFLNNHNKKELPPPFQGNSSLNMNVILIQGLVEPTHIAEILTMRKINILREHTICHLETTRVRQTMFNLECIQVTFFLNHFHWFYRIDMLLTFRIGESSNQFNAYSIIQSLFINNVSNGILFSSFNITASQFFCLFT